MPKDPYAGTSGATPESEMTEAISAPAEDSGVADDTPPSPARRRALLPEVLTPEKPVLKTVEDVKVAIAEISDSAARSVNVETVRGRAGTAPNSGAPSRRSGRKQKAERGDGRCPAYAPAGTKCKLCNKVHPL